MKLPRRKKKSTYTSAKVRMPKQKSSKRVKRKVVKSRSKLNPKVFLIALVPILIVGVVYGAIWVVNSIKKDEEIGVVQSVLGISDVPAYPESEFLFLKNINEPSVSNFVSTGNSAYRLPVNTKTSDVYSYYQEILPEYGWRYVVSADIASDTMKYGEYYTKEDLGLRIYSKFNDVWYELITAEEANTGLKSRVQEDIERDLLLANKDLQELLPDFPWVLKIPKEYLVSYGVTKYENMRSAEFKKLGTEEVVRIVPVGRVGGNVFDEYLRQYTKTLGEEWTVVNTIISGTSWGSALMGTISTGSLTHQVAVVSNTYDQTVYIIDSNGTENPFFEYIFSNIEPQTIKD